MVGYGIVNACIYAVRTPYLCVNGYGLSTRINSDHSQHTNTSTYIQATPFRAITQQICWGSVASASLEKR